MGHVQPADGATVDLWLSGRQGSDGDSSASLQPVYSGDIPLPVHPTATAGVARAAVYTGPWRGLGVVDVKLGTYNSLTCLETFLAVAVDGGGRVILFEGHFSWASGPAVMGFRITGNTVGPHSTPAEVFQHIRSSRALPGETAYMSQKAFKAL